MQQSKKDGTSPTNFTFFLYNLDSFLIISEFPEAAQKTCDRHTHTPPSMPPDRNIAEESRIFRIHCKIINAAEIPNWRCLTPHQDGRASLKE